VKTIIVSTFAVFCLLPGLHPLPAELEPMPFAEDCSFHLTFDHGDVNADIAVGENKGCEIPVNKMAVLKKGVKGSALLLGGKSIRGVAFKAEGNFSYTRPGTLSMWVQPVKWTRGDALPSDPKHPTRKLVTYAIFFMTPYSGKGYVGIERMTSPYPTRPDRLLFWSAMFEKVPNTSIRPQIDWADGGWRHVALTWKGQEIALYMDGERAGSVFLKTRIKDDGHIQEFRIGQTTEPTLVDEVAIYSRALSDKDVEELYASYRRRPPEKTDGP